jgi:hypothetical protein
MLAGLRGSSVSVGAAVVFMAPRLRPAPAFSKRKHRSETWTFPDTHTTIATGKSNSRGSMIFKGIKGKAGEQTGEQIQLNYS